MRVLKLCECVCVCNVDYNGKVLKHLSTFIVLSDSQYGFRKDRCAGDLLAILTDSWSSSFNQRHERFAVALDIPKTLERVWCKGLLSKLHSFTFHPFICAFIYSLLSDRHACCCS